MIDLNWIADLLDAQKELLMRIKDDTNHPDVRASLVIAQAIILMIQKKEEALCKTETRSSD